MHGVISIYYETVQFGNGNTMRLGDEESFLLQCRYLVYNFFPFWKFKRNNVIFLQYNSFYIICIENMLNSDVPELRVPFIWKNVLICWNIEFQFYGYPVYCNRYEHKSIEVTKYTGYQKYWKLISQLI